MSLPRFTLVTALVFLVADAIVIPLIMRPLFLGALGPQMLTELRLFPAGLFYLIHIGGLVFFAGLPALRGASHRLTFLNGAMLGLVTYSCYEMTSWTIMRDWTATLVIVDMAWGTLISGLAALAGAVVAAKPSTR